MRVLSLFDGISVARLALHRLKVKEVEYYASEIDVQARVIARRNWPDTKFVGGVHAITRRTRPEIFKGRIDLLIGGSPCQDLSIAKKGRQGLKGSRSSLFWEYVRILKEVKPRYFVLENVNSMPKEDKDIITAELGVEPIMIDAALVSAQNRKRLFWTNIPGVTQPKDRGILLRDILQLEPHQTTATKAKTIRLGGRGSGIGDRHNWDSYDVYNDRVVPGNKAKTLGTNPQVRTAIAGQLVMRKGDPAILQYRRSYWRRTEGGKVPTLTANMGTGGNNIPYIEQVPRGKNKGGNVSRNGKSPTVTSSSFEHNNRLVFLGGIGGKDRAGDGKKLSRNYAQGRRVYSDKGKAASLTASGVGSLGGHTGLYKTGRMIRQLTPIECERLQSLPDDYTLGVSRSARFECIGNAFNAEVIKHILSFAKW